MKIRTVTVLIYLQYTTESILHAYAMLVQPVQCWLTYGFLEN